MAGIEIEEPLKIENTFFYYFTAGFIDVTRGGIVAIFTIVGSAIAIAVKKSLAVIGVIKGVVNVGSILAALASSETGVGPLVAAAARKGAVHLIDKAAVHFVVGPFELTAVAFLFLLPVIVIIGITLFLYSFFLLFLYHGGVFKDRGGARLLKSFACFGSFTAGIHLIITDVNKTYTEWEQQQAPQLSVRARRQQALQQEEEQPVPQTV